MNSNDELPDRQRWASVAARGLKPAEIGTFTTPLIRASDTVASIGTKLAAQLTPLLRAEKFNILRAEPPHPALADIPPEADEYLSFSSGYGEIRSARELLQLIRRSSRRFTPKEDRRQDGDIFVDLFRPGLKYPARSDHEFDLLLDRHLNSVRSVFRRCSVLIVALGSSEIRESKVDGAVLPIPFDRSEGQLDPDRHAMRTLTVDETIADLEAAVAELRAINPVIRVILIVSPEPLAATAAPVHVVAASAYGKAILRVAMERAAQLPGVAYFPAMEILAPLGDRAFDAGGRTLTAKAIGAVAAAMLAASEGGDIVMALAKDSPEALAAFIPAPSLDEIRGATIAERRKKRAAEQQQDAGADAAIASSEPDAEFSKLVRARERKDRKSKRVIVADKPEKPARKRREKPKGTLAERIAEKQRRALEAESKG